MDKHTWIQAQTVPKRGQALVIHGLNNSAHAMLPLAQLLQGEGYDTLVVSLHGHNPQKPLEMKESTLSQWRDEVKLAILEIEKKNKLEGGKKIALGYSLGGALLVAAREESNSYSFDHTLLLAPAIEIRSIVHLVKLFYFLGDQFGIPSLAPAMFRAQRKTSVSAYKALFALITVVRSLDHQKLNQPTTILIDEKDELVSAQKIKKIMAAKSLTKWNMIYLKLKKNHHFVFTSRFTEKDQWEQIIREQIVKI